MHIGNKRKRSIKTAQQKKNNEWVGKVCEDYCKCIVQMIVDSDLRG